MKEISRQRNRDVISDPRAVTAYPVPCFCAPCCTCVFTVVNYGKTKINKNQTKASQRKHTEAAEICGLGSEACN